MAMAQMVGRRNSLGRFRQLPPSSGSAAISATAPPASRSPPRAVVVAAAGPNAAAVPAVPNMTPPATTSATDRGVRDGPGAANLIPPWARLWFAEGRDRARLPTEWRMRPVTFTAWLGAPAFAVAAGPSDSRPRACANSMAGSVAGGAENGSGGAGCRTWR